MDGVGCAVILQCLARCCRARDASSVGLPTTSSHQESMRNQIQSLTTSKPASPTAQNVYGSSTYKYSTNQIRAGYTLRSDRLKYLAGACNAMRPAFVNFQKAHITADDVVAAVLWFCGSRARMGSSSSSSTWGEFQTSSLIRYLDVRELLKPALAKIYAGNAVVIARSSCTVEELGPHGEGFATPNGTGPPREEILAPFAHLAWKIHFSTVSIGYEEIEGVLGWVNSVKDWSSTILRPGDISVSSLRKLPLYTLDFGPEFGDVVNVASLESTKHGQGVINPARGCSVSAPWDVRIALPEKAIRELERDELFGWLLAVDSAKI